MYSSLPTIEIISYFSLCISVMLYFLWNVYQSGNLLVVYLGSDEYLVPGWPITSRLRDISDDEWIAWRSYIGNAVPWLFCHILSYRFCCYVNVYLLPFILVSITLVFLTLFINLNITLLFLFYGFAFYCSALTKSTVITWFVGMTMMLSNSCDVFSFRESLDYYKALLVEVSFAWLVLKGINFSLSKIKFTNRFEMLSICFAYTFYFPTFFFGPFIPFEDFYTGLQKQSHLNSTKCKQFLQNISKCCLWFIIIEISSHYIYCNVLLYHLNSGLLKNPGTLNGIGFCLAQFFYLKYLVYYGLGGSLAKFDGINAPPPPKCVNRIYLYSNMWRYFDRGYYLFTVKCIYKPICDALPNIKGKKFLASLVCFSFVFLWHGLSMTVFYWSLFNFICVSLEACSKLLSSHPIYMQFVKLCRNPQHFRRFVCLLASPLWIFSVISNYFFFAGKEYGFKLFEQFSKSDWRFHVSTLVVAYALCQISVEVENMDIKNNSAKETYIANSCKKNNKVD